MDSDAEEIWIKRLRMDVDATKINDTQSLLDEIDKTPNSYTTRTGKIVDLTHAKSNLKIFVNDLISGSGSLQDKIFDNNISDLKDAKTKDEIKDIEDRFIGIPKIEFDKQQSFRGEVALRERELLKEKIPEEITREDILASPRRRIKRFAEDFGITQDEVREVVVREGFTLSEDEKTFKK